MKTNSDTIKSLLEDIKNLESTKTMLEKEMLSYDYGYNKALELKRKHKEITNEIKSAERKIDRLDYKISIGMK